MNRELLHTDNRLIRTHTGKFIDPFAPEMHLICIEDIAHALSLICRWGGHCKVFLSVAQHSLHVSKMVSPDLALMGLLHDAPEYLFGDMPSPIKHRLPDYVKAEKNLLKMIFRKFGLDPEHYALIKPADIQAMHNEYTINHQNEQLIANMPNAHIEQLFLKRFKELTK